MKILLLSDLSNRVPKIPSEVINNCDLVLLAGDITMGARSERLIIKVFTKLAALFPPPLPVFFLPGNHDHPDLMGTPSYVPDNFFQMHNKISTFSLDPEQSEEKSLLILGFGGSTPIPGFPLGPGPNYITYSEEELHEHLTNLFEETESIRQNPSNITLLFLHTPPINTQLDLTHQKVHVGSSSVREVIEKNHPHIVVAGHIHESKAIDYLGETLLVNSGEAKYGHYAVIEMSGDENSAVLLKIEKNVKVSNPPLDH